LSAAFRPFSLSCACRTKAEVACLPSAALLRNAVLRRSLMARRSQSALPPTVASKYSGAHANQDGTRFFRWEGRNLVEAVAFLAQPPSIQVGQTIGILHFAWNRHHELWCCQVGRLRRSVMPSRITTMMAIKSARSRVMTQIAGLPSAAAGVRILTPGATPSRYRLH